MLAVTFLSWAVFASATAVRGYAAAARADAGEGTTGVFVAIGKQCSRSDCAWYGPFLLADVADPTPSIVRLRGVDDDEVEEGLRLPAIDVGVEGHVYVADGSSGQGGPIAGMLLGAFLALVGVIVFVLAASNTRWSAARRPLEAVGTAARRRALARGLLDGDRWGRIGPATPTVLVRVRRSRMRTAGWLAALPFAVAAAVGPSAILLDGAAGPRNPEERLLLAWFVLFSVFAVTASVQILRMALLRPKVVVAGDELVIRDSVLLWRTARIPRAHIAAARTTGSTVWPLEGEAHVELTPFRERLNLDILLREDAGLAARRLRWGNWLWVAARADQKGSEHPLLPVRNKPCRRISLRVEDPREAAAALTGWIDAGAPAPSPQEHGFAPTDHFLDGRERTTGGTGAKQITLKGGSPQPLVAEIANDAPAPLHVVLSRPGRVRGRRAAGTARAARTGRAAGTGPAVTIGTGEPAARVVVGDREPGPAGDGILAIDASGPWTVRFGGPGLAGEFTRKAGGRGADVLRYTGPPGIAVVNNDPGGGHELHVRRADLTSPYGSGSTAAFRDEAGIQWGALGAGMSAVAVPTGAVLQITATGPAGEPAGWEIDVVPLQLVAEAPGLLDGPGAGHVRAFRRSVSGIRASVLLYLGPTGPVRVVHKGRAPFGVDLLSAGMAPEQELVRASGVYRDVLELRTGAVLQISGGPGRWSFESVLP